jgi:DNA-binding response OmpR family regulator
VDNPNKREIGVNIDTEIKLVQGRDLDFIRKQPRPRVLIVDDDTDFIEMLKLILRYAGFDVAGATESTTALEKCAELNPDVILLDLMIPGVDGWGIYQILREITRAPVIVVSASGNRENAVRSLEMGIYDYISKPFYNPEIIARINRVLQRVEQAAPLRVIVFPNEDIRIDFESQEVVMRGETIELLPREFKFLAILAATAPKKVNYKVLSDTLWGEHNAKTHSHLKTIVFSLRQKMEVDSACPKLILNFRGVGYQLNVTKSSSLIK